MAAQHLNIANGQEALFNGAVSEPADGLGKDDRPYAPKEGATRSSRQAGNPEPLKDVLTVSSAGSRRLELLEAQVVVLLPPPPAVPLPRSAGCGRQINQ